jgi:hypothetical protein
LSTTNPYQFRFKVYYKIPLVEMKNPKSWQYLCLHG